MPGCYCHLIAFVLDTMITSKSEGLTCPESTEYNLDFDPLSSGQGKRHGKRSESSLLSDLHMFM
jgi:hypothetical protein